MACLFTARSTSRRVLHREHSISSQGKPASIAADTAGDGSTGPPWPHIRSFHAWQFRLSAFRSSTCASARAASACRCSIEAMPPDSASSFFSALRKPPERGIGSCFGAMAKIVRRSRLKYEDARDGSSASRFNATVMASAGRVQPEIIRSEFRTDQP